MSDNVVSFPSGTEPQLLVLSCDCGGATFFVRSDHRLVCAACDETMDDDVTGIPWDNVQAVDRKPRAVRDFGTVDLAFKRVLTSADTENTAALIVMNRDGHTHVWSDEGWEENDDIKSWYQERVDDLMEQLK